MKTKFVPLKEFPKFSQDEMLERSEKFLELMSKRRSIRSFSDQTIPQEVIENAIRTAGTAPSGANMQPWFFAIVKNPDIKKTIRVEAEKEEKEFYSTRAPEDWLKVLEQFETNEKKPFLEKAPYLIVVFERKYKQDDNGKVTKHYYTKESVGIATGMLITALHNSGIAALTHTPSPMNFLNQILNRPQNEKPFLIVVAGIPGETTTVPNIKRKEFDNIASIY
ncbi:MAG: nitroreductase family protein [Bacteroidota bacterium]